MQRAGQGKEITSLAKNKPAGRPLQIVAGTEDRVVLLYMLDGTRLVPIFSVQMDKTIPASVAFADNKEDILVFGLRDGMMSVINCLYGARR